MIPGNTEKVAVTIPKKTFKEAEALRKKIRKSRSALYATALEEYLRAIEVRETEARYAAGYRALPETPAEIRAATAAATLSDPGEW